MVYIRNLMALKLCSDSGCRWQVKWSKVSSALPLNEYLFRYPSKFVNVHVTSVFTWHRDDLEFLIAHDGDQFMNGCYNLLQVSYLFIAFRRSCWLWRQLLVPTRRASNSKIGWLRLSKTLLKLLLKVEPLDTLHWPYFGSIIDSYAVEVLLIFWRNGC